MSEYIFTIGTVECDIFCHLPPKRLFEYFIESIFIDLEKDGCGLSVMKNQFGAVWMVNHVHFIQYSSIFPNDIIRIRTNPRREGPCFYFYDAQISRGDEILANIECSLIPVYSVSRHIMRSSLLSHLWNSPAPSIPSSVLHRLRPNCEFHSWGNNIVRFSDCDINRHMTSGAYISLACDIIGYWDSDVPRQMKELQVDFSKEVYAGTILHIFLGSNRNKKYIRGLTPDGKIAFTAECEF